MERLEKLVLEGAEYLENGDPLKDVMNSSDINYAIVMLASLIKDKYGIK